MSIVSLLHDCRLLFFVYFLLYAQFLYDVDELAMAYVQEGSLSHLSKEQLQTEMIIHSDMKERIFNDCEKILTYGQNFLRSLVLKINGNDHSTVDSNGVSVCAPVAECLTEVEKRKVEWEGMWNERLNKLQKLADGGAQTLHSTSEVSTWGHCGI